MGRDDAEGYAVEHRTFGKLVDQLKELTAAQAEKVVAALRRRGDGGAVRRVIEPAGVRNSQMPALRVAGHRRRPLREAARLGRIRKRSSERPVTW